MASQNGAQFQPLPSSAYLVQSESFCSSKHWWSYFPFTVFISWSWQVINSASIQKPNSKFQAFFFVLLLWTSAYLGYFTYWNWQWYWYWFFVILIGILPAVMLRQGVTQGRPARWALSKYTKVKKSGTAWQSM